MEAQEGAQKVGAGKPLFLLKAFEKLLISFLSTRFTERFW